MRIALDTNVLAYAEGLGDQDRCRTAMRLVERLPGEAVILPAQTLGELFRVLSGKARRSAPDARKAVQAWADSFEVVDSTWFSFQSAFDLAVDHQLPVRDALILAVAAGSRCRALLSEDFHSGFTWHGVTVVDPFASAYPPWLSALLA